MSKFISIIKKLFICLAVLMLLTPFAYSEEERPASFATAKGHWTVLGGYGEAHPGFGSTETRVREVDLILQYGHFLTKEGGRSWYKVRHEMMVELPISAVFNPRGAIMAGINLLACWDFTASETIVPYVFAGGGLVYTNLNMPGLGRELNGNYQTGTGIHYFLNKKTILNFNYRLHHISNANTAEPNEPLNSSKFLMGMSFLM